MSDDSTTLRPSLPTLGWAVLALWAALAAAQWARWSAYTGAGWASRLPAVLVVSSVAIGAVMARAWHRRPVALIALAAWVAGVLIGSLFWSQWAGSAAALQAAHPGSWEIEVLGDETASSFGSSSPGRVASGALRGTQVVVQWPKGFAAPPLGARVEVWASAKPPATDERGLRLARAGVAGTLSARRVEGRGWARSVRGVIGPVRLWCIDRVREVPGSGGDLLAGVVVGDRRRLAGTQADLDFRTTGLTHLVAVSGSHLVVVAAVVSCVAAACGLGRSPRAVLVGCIVGAYVVFSGVQPSAVRAWVMAVAASVSWLAGRRVDGGSALTVAAAGVLLVSPASAFDLGFQLSVAAVAGLVLFARLTESWLLEASGGHGRWVLSAVALTLTATAATLAITVSTFGSLSLISPVANVVAGPLVSAALVAGLAGLCASAILPPVGRLVLHLASLPSALAVGAAHWLASLPHAAIPVGVAAGSAAFACAVLGAGIWAAWPRPTAMRARVALAALVVGVVLLALGPPGPRGSEIEMLDVGQGDAILVRDAGHAVLVDCGPSPGAMRAALARTGVRRLDAVVITHLHADHYGGLGGLEGLVKVPAVFVPIGALGAHSPGLDEARRLAGPDGVRELSAGAQLRLPHLVLEVLWPRDKVEDPATNEASIVLRAREGSFRALLTGDAEAVVLDPLVEQGILGDIDVLKVGHHGSAEAVSPSDLAVLRPEWALVSVGRDNRFGHPTVSTLRMLAQAGSQIVRTDDSGDVTVTIDENGAYRVTLARRVRTAAAARAISAHRSAPQCAKLRGVRQSPARSSAFPEQHGQAALRVQTRLPHLRRARPPPRARSREAQGRRGRRGGSGLQLRDV